MRMVNETKGTVLTEKLEKVHGASAVSGLIGKKEPEAIFFETRFGIHTFGVGFPIDVLILDDADKVSALRKGIKPRKVFFWNPKYKKVVELPAGLIEESKTDIGDKLKFQK